MKKIFVNNQIRAKEVRVIDENGKQLGIMPLEEAINIAKEHNLDLIQVTEKLYPPVCKIFDFGKYQYQQQKKEKELKPSGGKIKEIRLSFGISEHDLQTKANSAEKFLKKGDIVRVEIRLKGREKAHFDLAEEKIKKFIEMLDNLIPIKMEKGIKKTPQGFSVIIFKK
ncbi:MAG TPA: translation initiation factor IF-3 [Candidatus Pacearchaeota archaeon]|nr:translation initiation factor IF-3 [Candidatus Pacearchaeota archaeon]HOL90237.1 translation initiation factor IF-3 [Candidatus Pacearchaeota archaeon]HPO68382.1 translation initiation factor IF-3 [Candidatus Pacearchaeota archaeon]